MAAIDFPLFMPEGQCGARFARQTPILPLGGGKVGRNRTNHKILEAEKAGAARRPAGPT
jgi:hypothetical protein